MAEFVRFFFRTSIHASKTKARCGKAAVLKLKLAGNLCNITILKRIIN